MGLADIIHGVGEVASVNTIRSRILKRSLKYLVVVTAIASVNTIRSRRVRQPANRLRFFVLKT